MKIKVAALTSVLALALLTGCAQKAPATSTSTSTASSSAASKAADVTTTASVVDTNAAFKSAIGKDGKWIICTLKDLTFTEDLTLEGEFKNGKKDANGKDVVQRKIGLYTQDANKVVTARFTLTAPKLTILSPEASIQHGTFKGDVYVSVKDFSLVDAKVDGNVYFTTDEAQSTFKMDATSSITGKKELKK